VAIETNGSVGSEVEIRPSALSSAILETPTIGIDAAGIATVGWVLNMSGRSLQARRVDTTGSMTPLGSGPVTLNDDVPVSYYQYAPLFGVDPGGDVVLGWYETDSSQDSNDAMARVLGDGAFADAGVVGPRLQLDGPSPEGAWVTDIVPEPAGIRRRRRRSPRNRRPRRPSPHCNHFRSSSETGAGAPASISATLQKPVKT
jgi:hypothetical protein